MNRTNTRLQSQPAPCGKIVDAHTYQDEEDEELVVTDVSYACGCRTIRQEYHDGTVSRTVLGHNGKPVVNELLDKE
jgi:hypothetical protein